MSTKYEISDKVPNDIICQRLNVLSDSVVKGRKAIDREFHMSIPAQCDHDADLVLSAASKRIADLEKYKKFYESVACLFAEGSELMTKMQMYEAIKREFKLTNEDVGNSEEKNKCSVCGELEELYAPSRETGEFVCYDCWLSCEQDG